MEYSKAYQLADAIKASEEYTTYHSLKGDVMGDATTAALIKEYKKLQITIQMGMMSGQPAGSEDMQRFQMLGSLLFGNSNVSQYLLAEMRLQQAMADIFKIITEATGIELELPGMEG